MMRRLTFAAAILIGLGSRSYGGIIVDQSQTVVDSPIAGFGQGDLAQSFQQANSNITGAAIQLDAFFGSGTGDITIALYDKLPNAGGALLGSGTATGVSLGQLATVAFGSAISVTPNTTYYLVFTSTNSSLVIGGSSTDTYSRGIVYANAGFGPFPRFDYAFRTFADDAIAAVPEPSTFAGAGMGSPWRWASS